MSPVVVTTAPGFSMPIFAGIKGLSKWKKRSSVVVPRTLPHYIGRSYKPLREPRIVRPKTIRPVDHGDTITCKECGVDYRSLIAHVSQIHGLKYYKNKYGITDNKELYPPDFLVLIQQRAREAGTSQEAVRARTRYWSNPKVIDDKSKWMTDELERRLKNPAFKEKWDNRDAIKKFTERQHAKLEKTMQETKTCLICKKVFGPKLVKRNGGLSTEWHWKTKKYCSWECRKKALIGVPKSPEAKRNMSHAHKAGGVSFRRSLLDSTVEVLNNRNQQSDS